MGKGPGLWLGRQTEQRPLTGHGWKGEQPPSGHPSVKVDGVLKSSPSLCFYETEVAKRRPVPPAHHNIPSSFHQHSPVPGH